MQRFRGGSTTTLMPLGIALAVTISACGSAPSQITVLEPESENPSPPLTTEAPAGEAVQFGVLAIDSAVSVNERYDTLLAYLSETIGRPFELVPLTQESQFVLVEAQELDFTTNNPLAAVQLQRLYQTQFLVTHSRPQTGTQFSALIIVRNDSDITELEDLRGKHVACVDFETAAAGCIFQIQHLLDHGIDPFTEFSEFEENKSQDNIVFSVLNGSLDAGFIRTGQLEKMIKRGILDNQAGIRVLDPAADGFYYTHTTALYPEWPIAALADTDPALVDAVKTALLTIPPDHPALQAANIASFEPVADYTPIERLIENLKLKSWDAQ